MLLTPKQAAVADAQLAVALSGEAGRGRWRLWAELRA